MCEHLLELLLTRSPIASNGKFELHGAWFDDGDAFTSNGEKDDPACLRNINGSLFVCGEEDAFYNRKVGLCFFEEVRKVIGDFLESFEKWRVGGCFDREPLWIQTIMCVW